VVPALTPEQQALCAVLIDARNQAKMTQRQLASRLNKIQSFVGKIELGDRQVTVVEFIEIAQALGADPVKLLAKVVRASNA
jgi:transcriptional regulator with XRE-family HTH domain